VTIIALRTPLLLLGRGSTVPSFVVAKPRALPFPRRNHKRLRAVFSFRSDQFFFHFLEKQGFLGLSCFHDPYQFFAFPIRARALPVLLFQEDVQRVRRICSNIQYACAPFLNIQVRLDRLGPSSGRTLQSHPRFSNCNRRSVIFFEIALSR